jgi:hypothetical protein
MEDSMTSTISNAAAALGRLGGQAKSKAKTKAARTNGLKGGDLGGRPRKFEKMSDALAFADQAKRAINAIVDGKRYRVHPRKGKEQLVDLM